MLSFSPGFHYASVLHDREMLGQIGFIDFHRLEYFGNIQFSVTQNINYLESAGRRMVETMARKTCFYVSTALCAVFT